MKLSSFIISMLIISLFVAVFMNFFSELNDKYTIDVDYNSSDWETYNQLATLKNDTEAIQSQTQDIQEQAGALDVIGSYFSSAYKALSLTKNSVTSAETIIDAGIEDSNLGVNAEAFKTVLVTILLVIVFVGILLSALIKREL